MKLAKSLLVFALLSAAVLASLIVPAFHSLPMSLIQTSENLDSGTLLRVSGKLPSSLVFGLAILHSERFAIVIRQNGDLWLELGSQSTSGSAAEVGNARSVPFRIAILPALTGFLRQ